MVSRYNRCRPATTPYCKVHLPMATSTVKPATLRELRDSGWQSKTVKQEIHDNFLAMLAARRGAVPRHRRLRRHGHPRAQHRHPRPARHAVPRREGPGQEPADAAAGRAFSTRRFRTSTIPASRCTTIRYRPITERGRQLRRRACRPTKCRSPGGRARTATPSGSRPGTKFADIIGEIDPAKLAGGVEHGRRRRPALRPDPAHAPRHLRHERAAGARRAGASRPVQHSRRARRADPRLPGQVRHRRADPVQRQPGHVQPLAARSSRSSRTASARSSTRTIRWSATWASRSWSRRRERATLGRRVSRSSFPTS